MFFAQYPIFSGIVPMSREFKDRNVHKFIIKGNLLQDTVIFRCLSKYTPQLCLCQV
jgi:hypothetical protein